MLNSLRKLLASEPPRHYIRRWQRILMSEPAKIVQNGQTCPAMLTQVGAGGARVTLAKRLRPGDVVNVEFTVVGGHRSLSAMVVYAAKEERGYQWLCGLSFIDVDARGDRRIGQFVEEEQHRRQTGFAMPRA
jgi:c-di-GMP-binding flagellar brake protein YcgR